LGVATHDDYRHANCAVAKNPDDLAPAEWQARAAFFERAFEILNRRESARRHDGGARRTGASGGRGA